MLIKISEAIEQSNSYLQALGLSQEESELITQNLIDAELAGRKTHGFVRLPSFKKKADEGTLNTEPFKLEVINETPTSLHINGRRKLGYAPIYKSLEAAFEKIKTVKLFSVALKDLSVTGYIGSYARIAAEHDLIFVGFNNSPGGLIPYGSKKELWGTNPLTIGVPTDDIPVILDMASSQITWGDLLVAKSENKQIKEGVAVDTEGNPTTDPAKAMEGGLLPFAGHKGSGLGFIVELLGGALTGSRVGYAVPGGWGSFYILIDPTIFRPLKDFKRDIRLTIGELKIAPRADGFQEIYFPGEQSHNKRLEALKNGTIEINDKLYESITEKS